MGYSYCGGCGVDWDCTVISVSLLYVHNDGQVFQKSLSLTKNSPLKSAIIASGWLDLPEFNAIKQWLDGVDDNTKPNAKAWYVGVFSVKKSLDYPLQDGDRVEFYRPLTDDPMKKRQSKVQIAKKKQAQLDSMPKANKRENGL